MQGLPVLVIAEDPDLAALMGTEIDAWGYQTAVATSIGEALRLIAQQTFSLIVADYAGPRQVFPYRWPILELLARFAPQTPVLALATLPEAPRSGNLAAVVPLPSYANALKKGLREHALTIPEPGQEPFLARYLAAVWEADVDEADGVVSDVLRAGWSGAEIYERLFTAALYEIGAWWEGDSCEVADEHGARVITERLMARVSAVEKRHPSRGRGILLACVEGEQHELGVRMAADLFVWDGWEVRLLGANTPAGELIAAAGRRPPNIVGLSATMQPSWEAIRFEVVGLRAAGINAVLLGGQGFGSLDDHAVAALGSAGRVDRVLSGLELANRIVEREPRRSDERTAG